MNEAISETLEPKSAPGDDAAQESTGSKRNTTAPSSRRARLAKLAGTHTLAFMVAMSLFAAADSWSAISGLRIAGLLCILTGILAGITVTTLVHEWFHFFGARYSRGKYEIPARQGLFVYDWDFRSNSLQQFLTMSIAGTVGSVIAILLLWASVPADTWGRAALRGAAIASLVFAANIEWPVIRRARVSGDPLAELSKIDQRLLSRSFMMAGIVGVVVMWVLAP